MKTILGFELKKILCRKVNLIAIALGLLLIVVSDIALVRDSSLFLSEETTLKGLEAIKAQVETENALTTRLSEEFLTEFLRDYQRQIGDRPAESDYSLIAPKSNLCALIASNYAESRGSWNWEDLKTIDTENGIGFYEKRMEKIASLLDTGDAGGDYTEAEKAYWMQKAEAIETPFEWGSTEGWDLIWTGIQSLFFQLFIVSLCIAPVFAGEYQNRTDALILSSRYGKTKLVHGKILASFLFTLLYVGLCSLVSVGINICMLGTAGWNLPVQLWDTMIPYRLTAAGACALNLAVILLLAFVITAISLLLSAVCRSQMVVLAVDVLVLYGAALLQPSKTSGMWNQVLDLLPVNSFNLSEVMRIYNSYQMGNAVLSWVEMLFVVYILITVLCTCCAGRSFRKCQVGR